MFKSKLLKIFSVALAVLLVSCTPVTDKLEEVKRTPSVPLQLMPATKPYPAPGGLTEVSKEYPEEVKEFILERKAELESLAAIEAWGSQDVSWEKSEDVIKGFGMGHNLYNVKANNVKDIIITAAPKDVPEQVQDVSFSLFTFKGNDISSDEEKKGFGLVTDDKRLGGVIYCIEGEYSEEFMQSDFMQMYNSLLEDYVQTTVEAWATIKTPETPAPNNNARFVDIMKEGTHRFSSWFYDYKTDGSKYIQTNWHQNYPYNNCVNAVKGGDKYITGCGVVQTAQLMAYHKFPTNFTSPNISTIKSKWSTASSWDGKYNWNSILNNNNMQIAALMYDVGVGCSATYKPSETITYDNNTLAYLQSIGYNKNARYEAYNYNKIKASIEAGCPVPISGTSRKNATGHAFIIDGVMRARCGAENDKHEVKEITADYVHCNIGWGAGVNGWYFSGVFYLAGKDPKPFATDMDINIAKINDDTCFYSPIGLKVPSEPVISSPPQILKPLLNAYPDEYYFYQYSLLIAPNLRPGN